MKSFIIFFILAFLIKYIQNQKPENITIFNIPESLFYSEIIYEFTVSKNEIFGFEFSKGRGVPYEWRRLNESSKIQFLYSKIYDYLSEADKKLEEEAMSNSNSIKFIMRPTLGGSEFYYEVFKALNESDQPITFDYNYIFLSNIQSNISINIWICDEIHKDQCINNETMKCVYNKEDKSCFSRPLCGKIEEISEDSCNNAVTSTPSLTKCIYEKVNEVERCSTKNLCINSFTEEECNSSFILNPETSKCIFNSEKNKCELKEICELEENPSLEKCDQILTSNPSKIKCIFDSAKEKCVIKTLCPYVGSPSYENCENSLVTNEGLKCFFDEKNNKCVEKRICNLVKNDCEKAETLNIKTKCIYNEKENKCIEEEKLCNEISNGANEDICLNAKILKEDTQCIFNEEKNSCQEVDIEKEDTVKIKEDDDSTEEYNNAEKEKINNNEEIGDNKEREKDDNNENDENHCINNNINNLFFCLLWFAFCFNF